MFEIKCLTKKYGKKTILDNISLCVNEGEAIGILGVNGSGKSTLLSCIAKEYANSSEPAIGYVPQDNPLFDELKPIDNIKLWTKLNKNEIKAELSSSLKELGISEFLDTPVGKMSGGMKKRLSLATVLINKPGLLLLDEPFAALDLVAKQDILSYLVSFTKSGGSIIITSHEDETFNFCSRVCLLKNGTLIDADSLREQGISYIDMLRSTQ